MLKYLFLALVFFYLLYWVLRRQSNEKATVKPDTNQLEWAQKILGVAPQATREEIDEAYHRLIRKNHPDQGGSDYLAAQINEARNILLKGTKR